MKGPEISNDSWDEWILSLPFENTEYLFDDNGELWKLLLARDYSDMKNTPFNMKNTSYKAAYMYYHTLDESIKKIYDYKKDNISLSSALDFITHIMKSLESDGVKASTYYAMQLLLNHCKADTKVYDTLLPKIQDLGVSFPIFTMCPVIYAITGESKGEMPQFVIDIYNKHILGETNVDPEKDDDVDKISSILRHLTSNPTLYIVYKDSKLEFREAPYDIDLLDGIVNLGKGDNVSEIISSQYEAGLAEEYDQAVRDMLKL